MHMFELLEWYIRIEFCTAQFGCCECSDKKSTTAVCISFTLRQVYSHGFAFLLQVNFK